MNEPLNCTMQFSISIEDEHEGRRLHISCSNGLHVVTWVRREENVADVLRRCFPFNEIGLEFSQ